MSDPCPTCGDPMTRFGHWATPERTVEFCRTCPTGPPSAVLPTGWRDAADEFFTHLFADVQPLIPRVPTADEIWADIRRFTEPSTTLVARPERAEEVRRAVGDAGLGLSVRVVESEFVPDGEALVIDHAVFAEAERKALRVGPTEWDETLRLAAERAARRKRAVKVTAIEQDNE